MAHDTLRKSIYHMLHNALPDLIQVQLEQQLKVYRDNRVEQLHADTDVVVLCA